MAALISALLVIQPSATAGPGNLAVAVDCTGAVGDAATINAAIANSIPGAEITIRGICSIDQPIRLEGDRSYRGLSRTGTVLRQAPGSNPIAILASDTFLDNQPFTGNPVSIRHLKVEGTGSGQASGIILRSWLSTIEDVWVTNMGNDGIRATNRSANGTAITNTQVNGRIVANFIENNGRHGVHVQDTGNSVTDWTLADNWIAGSAFDGIRMDNAAGWMVERNHIYGVGAHAINANRLFATSISDNYIEGFGESSTYRPFAVFGIRATIQGEDVGSVIHGNRIATFNLSAPEDSTRYRYVYLFQNYGTGYVSMLGNTIIGSDRPNSSGVVMRAPVGSSMEVATQGNIIEKVTRDVDRGQRVTTSWGQ